MTLRLIDCSHAETGSKLLGKEPLPHVVPSSTASMALTLACLGSVHDLGLKLVQTSLYFNLRQSLPSKSFDRSLVVANPDLKPLGSTARQLLSRVNDSRQSIGHCSAHKIHEIGRQLSSNRQKEHIDVSRSDLFLSLQQRV